MIKHCGTCGCSHEETEDCPASNFNVMGCSACNGNDSLIPVDACFLPLSDVQCGQCGVMGEWVLTPATVEDMVKHWKGYKIPNKTKGGTS